MHASVCCVDLPPPFFVPASLPVRVVMGMCLRCSAVRNEPVAERVPLQCTVFVIRDSMRTKPCVRQLVDLLLRLARSAVVQTSPVCHSFLPPPSPSWFLPSTVRTAASCSPIFPPFLLDFGPVRILDSCFLRIAAQLLCALGCYLPPLPPPPLLLSSFGGRVSVRAVRAGSRLYFAGAKCWQVSTSFRGRP